MPPAGALRYGTPMGRKRKAWLPSSTGRRANSRTGKTYPGYYVQWYDYAPGGKRTLHSKNFAKQAHAREFCKRFNAKIDLKAIDEIIPITIEQASQEFLPGLSTRSAETIRQYGTTIVLLIEAIGDINVCDIGRAEIDTFIAARMAVSSEATTAKHVRSLHRFFNWCIESAYASQNATKLATSRPRNTIARKKPRIGHAQFEALINALDTDDRKLAVQIAATTGLDRGVIQKIAASDVDVENRQFTLTRFKTHRDVYPYIHDSLMPAISSRLAQSESTAPLLRGLSHQGGPKDWWRQAVTAAGIPELKFVDLRTYAVNWLRAVVGHSTPQTTARHYYQSNPESQRLISGQPLPGSRVRCGRGKTSKGDTSSSSR